METGEFDGGAASELMGAGTLNGGAASEGVGARGFDDEDVLERTVQVRMLRLGSVPSLPMWWLWPQRVPMGKVTLLVGDPGRGKSLLALDMAARVTRGAPWPDAESGSAPLGNVILLSAEDDPADTIRPRLEAAGGDADRVLILHAVRKPWLSGDGDLPFSLSKDLAALETAIQNTHEVRLVVLDPVSAYLRGVDEHGNAAMREVLAPLRGVAERTGAAVVAISHLTKRAEAGVLYRAMGSLAFVAAARAVWAVGADRQASGRMLFLPVKCNLAGGVKGMAYRIVPSAQSVDVPRLEWEAEPVEMTAEEALESNGSRRLTARQEAAVWLDGLLSAGPMASEEVDRRARGAGISFSALRRAKHEMGLVAYNPGSGMPWMLRLEGRVDAAPGDAACASEAPQPQIPASQGA